MVVGNLKINFLDLDLNQRPVRWSDTRLTEARQYRSTSKGHRFKSICKLNYILILICKIKYTVSWNHQLISRFGLDTDLSKYWCHNALMVNKINTETDKYFVFSNYNNLYPLFFMYKTKHLNGKSPDSFKINIKYKYSWILMQQLN